jgi:hypothetical protein
VDYNLKVGWITTSDSVENAYLLHSDIILQIQVRWITTSDSVKNAYLLHSDVILQIQGRWITYEGGTTCPTAPMAFVVKIK